MAETIFPNPVWADVDHLEQLYVMWQPKPEMGITVIQESKDQEPEITFCSLFEDPERAFISGLRRPNASMTLTEVRDVLDRIERMIAERPIP